MPEAHAVSGASGWQSLPPELLHLVLGQGRVATNEIAASCALVCKAWHAALGTHGAAWASLQLALTKDATEARLQASLPRLRAIGARTTALHFACKAASRAPRPRWGTAAYLLPYHTPPIPGTGGDSAKQRELAERALALVASALPRLQACSALDVPLTGPALGPLLQHPTLQELKMGLGGEGLEVDLRPLERFGSVGASQLNSLTVRLSGSLMEGSYVGHPGMPAEGNSYDQDDRVAALLARLTAFSRVSCLHLEIRPDLQTRGAYTDGEPIDVPMEIAALTNLHSLCVVSAFERRLIWQENTDLSALVHLTRVEIECELWDNVAPGLSTLPALRRLNLTVCSGQDIYLHRDLQSFSRLDDLALAVVQPKRFRPGSCSGVAYGNWATLAYHSAAHDQAGAKLPLLQNLLLHCCGSEAAGFSWGSLGALTSLCLRDAAELDDVFLPNFPYLQRLVRLELRVVAVLPAQLKDASNVRHLVITAARTHFCTRAAADLLTGLAGLQHLDLVFRLDCEECHYQRCYVKPPSSVLEKEDIAKVEWFVRRLPAALRISVSDMGQELPDTGWFDGWLPGMLSGFGA